MKPSICTCHMRTCSMPTTTTTSTTLPKTPPTTPTPTTSTPPTTIGANQTLQESHASAITMPAAQSPEDNIALIGGVVGGAVALLLIGALIAFCVVRSRRQSKDNNANSLHSVHSTTTSPQSSYSRVPPAQSNYGERSFAADDVAQQPRGVGHADALDERVAGSQPRHVGTCPTRSAWSTRWRRCAGAVPAGGEHDVELAARAQSAALDRARALRQLHQLARALQQVPRAATGRHAPTGVRRPGPVRLRRQHQDQRRQVPRRRPLGQIVHCTRCRS
jgi:hypothetical protein